MKRLVVALLSLAVLVAPLAVEAQQTGKVFRIGILSTLAVADISGANPTHPHIRALVQRLGELGWAYGKNLVTEPRGADGKCLVLRPVSGRKPNAESQLTQRLFRQILWRIERLAWRPT